MDFDNNGRDDIISGSYHPGDLYLFRKQADGTYAKGEKILGRDGKPVNAGAASSAYLVDWDGDGDLDMLVGNITGEVWLFVNEGTREQPAYGAKQQIHSAAGAIRVNGGDAGPVAVDWDGDGRLDLIVGAGDGSVLFYRNISEDPAAPKLAAAETLIPAPDPRDPGDHGMRAKVHVVDWNGNGKLDLLVGDFSSVQAEAVLTGEARKKQDEANQKLAELTEQQQALAAAPDGETPDQRRQRQRELRDVQRQIIEVSRQAMAVQPRQRVTRGFVWLYLRSDADAKPAAGAGD